MFTGIIESLGKVKNIIQQEDNYILSISAPFIQELKIDQSVAHNGICLTVHEIFEDYYNVVAIAETIKKTNLDDWSLNSPINLERCLMYNGRIDGHIVQGHVDTIAICRKIQDKKGSWEYTFEIGSQFAHLIVDKGSICVNGISLTLFEPSFNSFKVAIIPYTFNNTNIQYLIEGNKVNIEFDIIGKYFSRYKDLANSNISSIVNN